MPYRLASTDGTLTFELSSISAIIGRAPTADLPVVDPTVSRRHAQILSDENGLTVHDLGSSNGTFVNGNKITTAPIVPGDVIAFGKVTFRLEGESPKVQTAATAVTGPTIVRQRAILDGDAPELGADEKSRRKLATLLEVSKGLGWAADTDALLAKIAGYAYQILEVDRVAIILVDEHGNLLPKFARDRKGTNTAGAIPKSIARKALDDKMAILTDNAGEDSRFTGQSVVMQQVRSAICVPLMGTEGRALGVLYVDSIGSEHRFDEDDLDFCVAFAGIAAVAIENGEFIQRIQRQVIARSNFERFFAPQIAQRIAESSETIRLGGDKRPVAVLFSDIRGFTALAESMRPEDTASLLTEYFTEMVDCVFRHNGTLDKFMGDALMAHWGAPIGGDHDADNAVAAAIDMMKALDGLNAHWRTSGRPELKVGIGLNYGEAFAGNIGSERRLEFTVIGDTVNTAYRLCSGADSGEILITEDVRRALTTPATLIERAPMELKNKVQPVTVYCVAVV
ncbi:MAG TPA: adenylate/guanylate cyclase domain-containing protein [Gemmatimonadaceae bacterium]|jgi:adenylate cyclase|nr:adenylate/guanylate cyclase domain-containing protein [Gemmatimonadaceae bacterium]